MISPSDTEEMVVTISAGALQLIFPKGIVRQLIDANALVKGQVKETATLV